MDYERMLCAAESHSDIRTATLDVGWGASGIRLGVILCASALLSACVPLPSSGPKISADELEAIKIGETTSTEVRAILGEPKIIWDTERVWVYEQGPSGAFLFVIPAGYTASIFLAELGDDVLIMRFDENDRIERLDRRVGPLFEGNYGNFLREWLADQETKTDIEEKKE